MSKTVDRGVKKPDGSKNDRVDNILLIVAGRFDLTKEMVDGAKYILAVMWTYPDNFHDMKCELAALGTLMYVVYNQFGIDRDLDFSGFCADRFGVDQAKKNIIQMYEAYGTVLELYTRVEKELAESGRRNRKIRYEAKCRKYCA